MTSQRSSSFILLLILLINTINIRNHHHYHHAEATTTTVPPEPEPEGRGRGRGGRGEPKVNNKNESERNKIAPFDTDIRNDCMSQLYLCQSEFFPHIFLQCPKSCTRMLQYDGPNMIGTISNSNNNNDDDVLWWETIDTVRIYPSGKRISTDRFDGTVTVLAIVPMYAGMSVYYYEMMKHIHKKFKPNVEIIILPINIGQGIHIKVGKQQKTTSNNNNIVILEEETPTLLLNHPFIKYLLSVKPKSGLATYDKDNIYDDDNDDDDDDDVYNNSPSIASPSSSNVQQLELDTDRVTFYIISADGYFIERLVSPTLKTLQQRIVLFIKTIDYGDYYNNYYNNKNNKNNIKKPSSTTTTTTAAAAEEEL